MTEELKETIAAAVMGSRNIPELARVVDVTVPWGEPIPSEEVVILEGRYLEAARTPYTGMSENPVRRFPPPPGGWYAPDGSVRPEVDGHIRELNQRTDWLG